MKVRIYLFAQRLRRDPEMVIPDELMEGRRHTLFQSTNHGVDFNSVISRIPLMVSSMLQAVQDVNGYRINEYAQYLAAPEAFDGRRKPTVPAYASTALQLMHLGSQLLQV